MRVFFLCTASLVGTVHDAACIANMDLDAPFSDLITAVCALLNWREQDWVFLYDPWVWHVIPRGRTPQSYNLDHNDQVWIYCVPAEANN
jgi:hypothetical protein